METEFICSQCRKVLYESERRSHISAEHLEYFPFGCPFCKKEEKMHLETTEMNMNQHISAYHNGNNLGYILIKDPAKEVELDNMIEQCRRFQQPIQQIERSSIDSKSKLRRALNLPDGAGTSIRNGNAAQNGSDLTQVKDEVDSDDDIMIIEQDIGTAMPNNTLDAILPEQAAQMEADESFEQSVARPITGNSPNCENSKVSNTVLPKRELSVNISIVPEPRNFTEPYVEMDFPSQSTLERKRRLPNNVSDNDSLESREKRTLVMNDEQLESGGHCSRDVNHGSANGRGQSVKPALRNSTVSQRKDNVERPTTPSQVTSSVPADSSQKQIITKLFIVISQGILCYETIDRTTYNYAPLSEYFQILAGSELCKNGCEVVIQFYESATAIPFNYRYSGNKYKEFTSLSQLKTFARQLHSIAFLWANVTIVAHFGYFKQKKNETPSQSDYCCELFSRERSVLKCKKLDVTLVDNCPLSIVTNVVDRCEECDLQLVNANHELQEAFLEEIYERDVLHRTAVTLCIPDDDVEDFVDKLKTRFQSAPQKCFKFELFTHSKEVRKLSRRNRNCILKARISKNHLESVIIEQCAIGS